MKEQRNLNQYAMFRNYLKIASRTFLHNKSYAFINIIGLALGLAASIVIFIVVKNELSYDSFHQKADRTYRVTVHALDYNPSVSFAVAPAFRNDFSEVEHVSQYFYRHDGLIKVGEDRYKEEGYAFADDQFTQIFDFGWLHGNPGTALKEPNSVVLTETIANKYFGTTDILGKTIHLDNKYDLNVTGVIKDLPSNTHLRFIFLVSWETIQKQAATSNFWSIAGGYLYVTLPDDVSAQNVTDRFPALLRKNWGEDIAKESKLILQPLKEIHFDQRYLTQITMPRSKETVYGLAGVALFIILTACINFVNLATAQSIKRLKEVGVRKTLGALKKQLMAQVLCETALLVMLSAMLAVGIVVYFLPHAESLLGIRIETTSLFTSEVIGPISAIIIMTILMAGLYPAMVQSRFQPIHALKSVLPIGERPYIRKALIVVQFATTQVLLVGTFVVGSQMDFFLNQNIGFDKDAIVTFPIGNNKEVLEQKLSDIKGIQEMSFSTGAPAYNTNFAPFSCPELGMTEVDVTEIKRVDENYMPMFRLELLAGKPVVKTNGGDSIPDVVVNETLIKRFGVEDPTKAIGQVIFIGRSPVSVSGVVKDFQSESKHKKIRACIILYDPDSFWQVSVKLQANNMRETLASVDEVWSELNPESLFSYEFLDEHIANLYKQEQQMFNSIRLFSGIAILIGCLGLYGLVSLIGAQRTKEIGIRKVLGASIFSIVSLFFKQFAWLIIIAFVIAAPLAWYSMNQWLREFAYHIDIDATILIISLLTTFIIAGITIGYQSVKAALINPVKSLRSE
jgi:putative ABC transport system permease protein